MTDKTNESPFRPYIDPTAYNTSDTTLDSPGYYDKVNQIIQDNPEHNFFEGTPFEQPDGVGETEEGEEEQVVEPETNVVNPADVNIEQEDGKPIRAQLDYTIPINAQ